MTFKKNNSLLIMYKNKDGYVNFLIAIFFLILIFDDKTNIFI